MGNTASANLQKLESLAKSYAYSQTLTKVDPLIVSGYLNNAKNLIEQGKLEAAYYQLCVGKKLIEKMETLPDASEINNNNLLLTENYKKINNLYQSLKFALASGPRPWQAYLHLEESELPYYKYHLLTQAFEQDSDNKKYQQLLLRLSKKISKETYLSRFQHQEEYNPSLAEQVKINVAVKNKLHKMMAVYAYQIKVVYQLGSAFNLSAEQKDKNAAPLIAKLRQLQQEFNPHRNQDLERGNNERIKNYKKEFLTIAESESLKAHTFTILGVLRGRDFSTSRLKQMAHKNFMLYPYLISLSSLEGLNYWKHFKQFQSSYSQERDNGEKNNSLKRRDIIQKHIKQEVYKTALKYGEKGPNQNSSDRYYFKHREKFQQIFNSGVQLRNIKLLAKKHAEAGLENLPTITYLHGKLPKVSPFPKHHLGTVPKSNDYKQFEKFAQDWGLRELPALDIYQRSWEMEVFHGALKKNKRFLRYLQRVAMSSLLKDRENSYQNTGFKRAINRFYRYLNTNLAPSVKYRLSRTTYDNIISKTVSRFQELQREQAAHYLADKQRFLESESKKTWVDSIFPSLYRSFEILAIDASWLLDKIILNHVQNEHNLLSGTVRDFSLDHFSEVSLLNYIKKEDEWLTRLLKVAPSAFNAVMIFDLPVVLARGLATWGASKSAPSLFKSLTLGAGHETSKHVYRRAMVHFFQEGLIAAGFTILPEIAVVELVGNQSYSDLDKKNLAQNFFYNFLFIKGFSAGYLATAKYLNHSVAGRFLATYMAQVVDGTIEAYYRDSKEQFVRELSNLVFIGALSIRSLTGKSAKQVVDELKIGKYKIEFFTSQEAKWATQNLRPEKMYDADLAAMVSWCRKARKHSPKFERDYWHWSQVYARINLEIKYRKFRRSGTEEAAQFVRLDNQQYTLGLSGWMKHTVLYIENVLGIKIPLQIKGELLIYLRRAHLEGTPKHDGTFELGALVRKWNHLFAFQNRPTVKFLKNTNQEVSLFLERFFQRHNIAALMDRRILGNSGKLENVAKKFKLKQDYKGPELSADFPQRMMVGEILFHHDKPTHIKAILGFHLFPKDSIGRPIDLKRSNSPIKIKEGSIIYYDMFTGWLHKVQSVKDVPDWAIFRLSITEYLGKPILTKDGKNFLNQTFFPKSWGLKTVVQALSRNHGIREIPSLSKTLNGKNKTPTFLEYQMTTRKVKNYFQLLYSPGGKLVSSVTPRFYRNIHEPDITIMREIMRHFEGPFPPNFENPSSD